MRPKKVVYKILSLEPISVRMRQFGHILIVLLLFLAKFWLFFSYIANSITYLKMKKKFAISNCNSLALN